MSTIILTDGTGSGNKAKVDAQNRVHTTAVASSPQDTAIQDGRNFLFTHGFTTLTSANESALFYIKNTSDDPFFVATYRLAVGASTSGTGPGKIRVYVNPTGGTLITDAVDSRAINSNLASSNDFVGLHYQGSEGKTIVAGTIAENEIIQPSVPALYDTAVFAVLLKGDSLAFTYQPPAGNTSLEMTTHITGYYLDEELS